GPEVEGPPNATGDRKDVAAPGRLSTPPLKSVLSEANKAKEIFKKLNIPSKFQLVINGEGGGLPGSMAATEALLTALGVDAVLSDVPGLRPIGLNNDFDSTACMQQQFYVLLNHAVQLI